MYHRNKIAQQVDTCHEAWRLEIDSHSPHGRRKEQPLVSCPLTSTINGIKEHKNVHMCAHTQMRERQRETKNEWTISGNCTTAFCQSVWVGSVCISYFSHYCDKIFEKAKQLLSGILSQWQLASVISYYNFYLAFSCFFLPSRTLN